MPEQELPCIRSKDHDWRIVNSFHDDKGIMADIARANKTIAFKENHFSGLEAKVFYKYLAYLLGGAFVVLGLGGLIHGEASRLTTVVYYIFLLGSIIGACYGFYMYMSRNYDFLNGATRTLNDPIVINAKRIYRLVESYNAMVAIWNHARNGHLKEIEEIPDGMMDYPERLGKLRQLIDRVTTVWNHERERQELPVLDGDHPSIESICSEAEELCDGLEETAREHGQTRVRHDHMTMLDDVEDETRATLADGQRLRGRRPQAQVG